MSFFLPPLPTAAFTRLAFSGTSAAVKHLRPAPSPIFCVAATASATPTIASLQVRCGSSGSQRTANFKRVREEQQAKMQRLRKQVDDQRREQREKGVEPKKAVKLSFTESPTKKTVGLKGMKKPKFF